MARGEEQYREIRPRYGNGEMKNPPPRPPSTWRSSRVLEWNRKLGRSSVADVPQKSERIEQRRREVVGGDTAEEWWRARRVRKRDVRMDTAPTYWLSSSSAAFTWKHREDKEGFEFGTC